jgi:hypothetical protein
MLQFPAENYVDGQVLFQLTEKELLDIIQPIGIVKNIMSLIQDQVFIIQSVLKNLHLTMVYRARMEQNPALQGRFL